MLTRERIQELVGELTDANKIALVRCEAGKPFGGDRVVIGRIRELELVGKTSWNITEKGRQVVGELVGIPYKWVQPRVVEATTNGKFKPTAHQVARSADAMRATVCVQCGGEVLKGETVFWAAADEGVFHPGCIDLS